MTNNVQHNKNWSRSKLTDFRS